MEQQQEPPGPLAWQRDWDWLSHCPRLVGLNPLPDWLETIFRRPLRRFDPLERFFSAATGSHRVGRYVEALVESALEGGEAIEEVRSGVPVRRGKQTLGELDFLFRHEGRLHHLEVALKFYLHRPVADSPENDERFESRYLGPNAADNFERKAGRLRDHQLPLGKRTFPEVTASFLFCPGLIFYPPASPEPVFAPDELTPGHARGLWMHPAEFARWAIEPGDDAVGAILEKPFWLGAEPVAPLTEIASMIEAHFAGSDRPCLIAWKPDPGETMSRRLFVVADAWPSPICKNR